MPDCVAIVEMRFPDGAWRAGAERHNFIGDERPDPDIAREFAATVLAMAVRLRTTQTSLDKDAWPLRVTVRSADEALIELEAGTVLYDADTDAALRQATWRELEASVNSIGGIFEAGERRFYVA